MASKFVTNALFLFIFLRMAHISNGTMSESNTLFSSFRVKLAVNRDTQEAIAVKIIDLEKAADKDCYDNVRKEVGKRTVTI